MQKLFLVSAACVCAAVSSSAYAATAPVGVRLQGSASVRSIPPGSQRVEMLSISLTNESADTETILTGIDIRHRGMGDVRDISSVYLAEKGTRISRTQAVPRDGLVHFRFYPPLTISAQQTRTFTVLADYSPTANVAGEHRFTLDLTRDVFVGDQPVVLREQDDPHGQARVVPRIRGAASVTYLSLLKNVRFGSNQTVARIKISADNVENLQVESMTLTNDGKAHNGDIQNIRMENTRGAVLSNILPTLSGPEGKSAAFVFSPPLQLDKNASLVLYVKADVRARRKQTIRFLLEEPADMRVVPNTSRQE